MLSTLSRILFLNNASSSNDSVVSSAPTNDPENPPVHLDLTTGHIADAGKGLYFGPRFQLGNSAVKTTNHGGRKKKKKKSLQGDLGSGQVWQPIPNIIPNNFNVPEVEQPKKKQPFMSLTIPFSIRNIKLEGKDTNNSEITEKLYSLQMDVDTLIACRVGCVWGYQNGEKFPNITTDIDTHPRGKIKTVELKGPEETLQSKSLEFFVPQDWLELCLKNKDKQDCLPEKVISHALVLVLEAHSSDVPTYAMIYELQKKLKKRNSDASTSTSTKPTVEEEEEGTTTAYYELQLEVQRLKVGEKTYVLKDVYGQPRDPNRRESISQSSSIGGGGNRDCVVCLCEPKTVLPLPCRHCCLCMDCAQVLKSSGAQCPVCRQPFHSLVKVDYPDEEEEEEVVGEKGY